MGKRSCIVLSLVVVLATVLAGAVFAGTTGDVSYSVTWKPGPGANQTTLVVKNTADPGGEMISDFYFQIAGSSVQITSVSGGGCSVGHTANGIFCGNALAPGDSETITITTADVVAAGTDATITFDDNAEASQPAVTVKLGTTSHHHHKKKHHRRKHHRRKHYHHLNRAGS
jgi:hypothetical protein